MTDNPYPVPQASRNLTRVAWGATILASALPNILWTEVTRTNSEWMEFSKINLLLALAGVAFAWKPLRPLRHYLLVLPAAIGLLALIKHGNFTLPPLQALFGSTAFDARMQAEQTGKLVAAVAMIVLLLALGFCRRDFFLRRGEIRAPIQPVPLLGFPKPDPWPRFGLQWAVYIAGGLAVVQYLGLRPDGATMLKVLPMLPSVLFYAAINSFNEEMIIRAPMIATVEPVGGSRHALWMSAVPVRRRALLRHARWASWAAPPRSSWDGSSARRWWRRAAFSGLGGSIS